jgi:hypothetical protein
MEYTRILTAQKLESCAKRNLNKNFLLNQSTVIRKYNSFFQFKFLLSQTQNKQLRNNAIITTDNLDT